MPRRLTDYEWSAFLNDVDVLNANLPPWGGVIGWRDQLVLVYVCPQDGELCRKGEVMLSDVSDRRELLANVARDYDANAGVWWYHVPWETLTTIARDAAAVSDGTQLIIKKTAEIVGGAAGDLTRPLLENLALPLIVVGLLAVVMYLPKPRPT